MVRSLRSRERIATGWFLRSEHQDDVDAPDIRIGVATWTMVTRWRQ